MPEISKNIPMLSTRAAVLPTTFDEVNRTVELTWTTGAQVRRFDWWEGEMFIEELDISSDSIRMDRLNSGAPVLESHSSYSLDSVIGVVERAWIDGNEGRALVRFSEREEVAPIIADVRSGILRNISVGYQVHRYEIDKPTDGSMPIWRAVDWEPMELSIVAIPADASAQIRSSQDLHPVIINDRSTAMSEPSENPIPAEESAPESINPVEETAESKTNAEPAQEVADAVRSALAVERQRAAGIRETVRMAKLDESIAEKLIDSEKPLDECKAEILRMWSERVDDSATPSTLQGKVSVRAAEASASLLRQVSGAK
jgi:hypothetical protein